VSRLSRLFEPVEDAGFGTLYPGPVDVVFDQYNMTLPDGVFVTAARQGIVTDTGIHGAPDLVMEILSPTSIDRDWSEKFATYQRFGVRSYWILDLSEQRLHPFDLVDGHYVERSSLGPGDTLASPLFPGISLAVGRLFPGARITRPPSSRLDEPPSRIDPQQPVDPAQVERLERWHLRRERMREPHRNDDRLG